MTNHVKYWPTGNIAKNKNDLESAFYTNYFFFFEGMSVR